MVLFTGWHSLQCIPPPDSVITSELSCTCADSSPNLTEFKKLFSVLHNLPVPQFVGKSTHNFFSYPGNKQTSGSQKSKTVPAATSGGGDYNVQELFSGIMRH